MPRPDHKFIGCVSISPSTSAYALTISYPFHLPVSFLSATAIDASTVLTGAYTQEFCFHFLSHEPWILHSSALPLWRVATAYRLHSLTSSLLANQYCGPSRAKSWSAPIKEPVVSSTCPGPSPTYSLLRHSGSRPGPLQSASLSMTAYHHCLYSCATLNPFRRNDH